MKHKIIAVVLTLLLTQLCVYADGVIIECEESTINIKINSMHEKYVNLIVSKKGEEIYNNDNIFAMKRSFAGQDGVVDFLFTMPDEKGSMINGEYDVVIKPDDEEIIKDTFIYATSAERKGLEEQIISAQNFEQIGEILAKEENKIILKAMQINIDDYILIEDKEDMLYNIFRNLEAVEESTEIKDCVNIEISMSFINESKDLKRHLLLINPEFEKTFFSELNKEEEAFIIEYIDANRSYENVEKMIEKYKEGCILYKINNTRFDKVEETLSEYANLLCIDNENEYISYKELRAKTTANEKFADMVKSSPVRSVEELLSVLKTSVNNTHSSSGTSFGGSSGGSDGGSSGGDRASIQSPVTVTKPVVINNIDFEDITEAEWAAEAITSMAKNGVVSGDGNGKFYPNREMTREEFIKMLVVAAKVYDKDAKCDFDDVEPEKWYYSYIASAMQSDMIYGVSETEFGVGNKLTRQDMAVVCYRAINKIKTLEKIREEKIFNDYQSISDYAKEAVLELYMSGIVNGVDENKFSPFATATRAQGAVIIHNLFF